MKTYRCLTKFLDMFLVISLAILFFLSLSGLVYGVDIDVNDNSEMAVDKKGKPLCSLEKVDIDVTNSEMEAVDSNTIVLRYISTSKGTYWALFDWNKFKNIWVTKACGEDFSFLVPHRTILIDGDYSDWDYSTRVYSDIDGPECGNAPGQDIREVYVAQDDNYIYIRYVLNGRLDITFGYKFGENLHIHVREAGYENGYIFYATPIPDLNSSSFPSNFVHIDYDDDLKTYQFEAKFYKCDVKGWWNNRELAAWCDQGKTTVCRDHAELPKMIFDFSPCE